MQNDLVRKLLAASKKSGIKSVEDNYMFNSNLERLIFQTIQTKYISYLLKICDIHKVAQIDNFSGTFLKDGAAILTMPITDICNMFIKLSHFPKD